MGTIKNTDIKPEGKCCSVPCDNTIINEGRCPCFNEIIAVKKNATMGSVTVDYHFCSREERQELIDYLSLNAWDFTEETSFITDGEIESK